MTTYKLNIKKLLTATIIMLSALSLPYTALADGKSGGGSETPKQNTNCSKDCSQAWSNVSNGGCKVDTNRAGKIVGSASNKLDTACLQNASKNSCFDSVPIDGGTGNYNTIGSRNNGTRNHYGTDIGASNTTSAKAYSVAEGEVVEYAPSTGGGNTMVINHPIKCSGSLGSHKGYHSVYRHLFKSLVGVGTKVKTRNEGGPAIGIVGGSNYKNGKLCQNPKQQNTGCGPSGVGGNGYYAIHLHLEIQAGLYSAGSGTQAKTSLTLQPYCQNIGVLCGGCPMPKKCGLRSGAPIPYGDASSIQNPGEGDSAGRGSPDNADVQDEGQCSLSKFLDSENCIFCGLFKTIFNAASSIAKSAMDGLAVPSKKIVGIGFLIWILLYLFKQIATPSGASTGEMLKGILFQGFRVAVVIIILTSALYSTMDLTLNPVLQTGLNFAQNLADFSKCPADAEYMKDINGYDSTKGYEDSSSTGGLSIEVGKAFVCSVKNMEDNVGVLMSVGKYLLCVSWHEEAWPGEIVFINAKLIPHLGYFFNGLAYYIVGLMLVLCAPWCLIDCVLQLCIAAGLIPCAIAAFAFKSTEKYLKIIWNFFMNSMFNFVFMAVILCIINSYIISWLKLEPDQLDKTAFIDPSRLAIYGINGGGFGGIVILGICFICWSFFGEAKEMAERFADSPSLGGSKGIGRLVGGTLASAGTSIAKPTIKLGAKMGSTVAHHIGSATNSAIGNEWRSGMNHFKGRAGLLAGRAFNRFGGHGHKVLNEEGKTIGYESSFNILGRRFSQKVQKDDSGMWIRETDRHISNGAERAFEKKYNAKGKAEQINLKDSNGNNIKDKDGNDIMVDAYQSKHRILGVTQERENMDAFLVDGKVVYRTADGTRQLTVDENGEIETYKTKFTNDEEKAQKHGGRRTVNDGFMKTSNTYNSEGEITGTRTHFTNETAKYLINKDGTINTYAMAQMQNGASDRDTADMAIIANVLQTRGQELSQTYSSRRITRGNDGSFTIEQTENDQKSNTPKKTIITAKMVDNVMVLDTKVTDIITDKNGKAHNHITHTVTNGMQFKTETFTQNDNGNYDYKARFGFANHVHANSSASPIDKDGNWHSNINRDQAMAGFTDADFKNHIQGLSGKGQDNIPAFQMQRQLNANAAALGINLAKEYEMLCQNGATAEKPFVINSINGEHELNYIDSQGLLIKKNFNQEGNQTQEFRYNPAESTRKMKTFTAEENEIRNTLNELKYNNIDNKINQIFSLYDIDDEPSDSDEFLEKSEQQTEEEEEEVLTEEEKEEEEVLTEEEEEDVLTEEENVQTEEENVPTEEENVPTEEENVPTEEENVPTEEENTKTEE